MKNHLAKGLTLEFAYKKIVQKQFSRFLRCGRGCPASDVVEQGVVKPARRRRRRMPDRDAVGKCAYRPDYLRSWDSREDWFKCTFLRATGQGSFFMFFLHVSSQKMLRQNAIRHGRRHWARIAALMFRCRIVAS